MFAHPPEGVDNAASVIESRLRVAADRDTSRAEPEQGGSLFLRVVAGPATGSVVDVGGGPVVIGRNQDGIARLGGDMELSREHATISALPDGRIVVEDMGSTNGTFVNGVQVTRPTVLGVGDAMW